VNTSAPNQTFIVDRMLWRINNDVVIWINQEDERLEIPYASWRDMIEDYGLSAAPFEVILAGSDDPLDQTPKILSARSLQISPANVQDKEPSQ
jgi:hypothetical protein